MLDVLSLAGLMVDVTLPIPTLPLEPGHHQMARGMLVQAGGVANFLIMAARLGLKTAPLGYVGDDPYGHAARQQLEAEGVYVSYLATPQGAGSDLTVLLVDDAGRHVFLGVLGTASGGLLRENWQTYLDETRAVYITGWLYAQSPYPYTFVEVAREARRRGKVVIFAPGPVGADPAWTAALLEASDVVLLDADQAAHHLSPVDGVRRLLEGGARLVGIRLGADGCLIATVADQRVAPLPGPTRETSASGDVFNAVCVYGYLADWPAERIACLASAAVAAAGDQRGNNPLPGAEAVWRRFETATARRGE